MPLTQTPLVSPAHRLASPAGLTVTLQSHGAIERLEHDGLLVNLYPGNAVEGGPANLYLRRLGSTLEVLPLLGPRSPTRWQAASPDGLGLAGRGTWHGLSYTLRLVLASGAPAWFWHLHLHNAGAAAEALDLVVLQDIGLCPYGAARLNEYYVSQYIDHAPLAHPQRGWVLAARQNQAAAGRHPWCVLGSLRRGVAYATDALQVLGLAARAGRPWPGLHDGLPGTRLQHEHALGALQDEPLYLASGASATLGAFGVVVPDHPAATGPADLRWVDLALSLPEAAPPPPEPLPETVEPAAGLPARAPLFVAEPLAPPELEALFGRERRQAEHGAHGELLSFFHGEARHVVLPAKELRVERPHGHLLRSGAHLVPDEAGLTSTTWMGGVFHSMLTEGHVSINRLLSTVHGYLGQFRSHGLRVYVEIDGAWQLLDQPSAYEMAPQACRWFYRAPGRLIEVQSLAQATPHALRLVLRVREGGPLRCLVVHHVALNGDDGSRPGRVHWWREDDGSLRLAPVAGSELAERFPQGAFVVAPEDGTVLERVGGDELLYADERSRSEPYLCLVTAPAALVSLRYGGGLVPAADATPLPARPAALALQQLRPPASGGAEGEALDRLAEILPWWRHNALVHYLSPRGLEQYSGGGWGTRDVCQGPLELLLADGQAEPMRDLLLRVFAAQNPDGDWPQWFMFFERERLIRAGDSHGDIVFWPVLALARYLIATSDATVLEERLPFFRDRETGPKARLSVWGHVRRALALMRRRTIAGTHLAAYGHGDWNDALQPADPALREHLCSAWTVTLHHQTLTTLADALDTIGRVGPAARCREQAAAVRDDFRQHLLVDGVLAGYALWDLPDGPGAAPARWLLHPRDALTGVRYSALAMVHAILEGLLEPDEMRAHVALIRAHLEGPDGLRLFDRPLAYHGGPQKLFQRAESASFFGREIGLMYMHAHLRWAQALAHAGDAEGCFRALAQANPVGLQRLVPTASLRQSNCYYSSSDAAFPDRESASRDYGLVAAGRVALDGGWRVYSSGAGIATGIVMRQLLGLALEARRLVVDPVLPPSLDGLEIEVELWGRPLTVAYRVAAPGCGVGSITLDGTPLPFERGRNPYRLGAAHLASAPLAGRLGLRGNRMEIVVGAS